MGREEFKKKVDGRLTSEQRENFQGVGKVIDASEFADMDGYIADAATHLDYMDTSILVGNLHDGQERVTNLRTSVEAFCETANNLKAAIISGDLPKAISYVSTDYGSQLVASYDAIDE